LYWSTDNPVRVSNPDLYRKNNLQKIIVAEHPKVAGAACNADILSVIFHKTTSPNGVRGYNPCALAVKKIGTNPYYNALYPAAAVL